MIFFVGGWRGGNTNTWCSRKGELNLGFWTCIQDSGSQWAISKISFAHFCLLLWVRFVASVAKQVGRDVIVTRPACSQLIFRPLKGPILIPRVAMSFGCSYCSISCCSSFDEKSNPTEPDSCPFLPVQCTLLLLLLQASSQCRGGQVEKGFLGQRYYISELHPFERSAKKEVSVRWW